MSNPTRLGDLLPAVADDLADRFDPTDLIAAPELLPGGGTAPDAPRQDSTDPTVADITPLADRFIALQYATAKAKEWADIAKDLQTEIKDAMGGDDGTAEVAVIDGQPVARWTRVKSRRFNQSAFKQADPATYDLYVEMSESRRFTLVDES